MTHHGVHVLVVLALAVPACVDEADNPFDEPDAQAEEIPDGWDGGDGGSDGDFEWPERDLDPTCRGLLELEGEDLRQALRDLVIGHQSLSYDQAREVMYASVDNQNGEVQCVYTGDWVTTDGIPPSSVMNTEHTWCQSWGSNALPAESDLNHLYPTLTGVNARRSNNPFGEVVQATWEGGGSALGQDAAGRTVFEPRDPHKGDCARAMFYFAIRYESILEQHRDVFDIQEDVLRAWNRQDLPDEREVRRNDSIEQIQLRRNPFIDCPEVVDGIPDF